MITNTDQNKGVTISFVTTKAVAEALDRMLCYSLGSRGEYVRKLLTDRLEALEFIGPITPCTPSEARAFDRMDRRRALAEAAA